MTKLCPRCKEEKPGVEFREREVRGRPAFRTYCKECEKWMRHRAWLTAERKGNRWDNTRRWEPLLSLDKAVRAVRDESEIRFAGCSISHQLRVFRATGRTGESLDPNSINELSGMSAQTNQATEEVTSETSQGEKSSNRPVREADRGRELPTNRAERRKWSNGVIGERRGGPRAGTSKDSLGAN